MNAQTQEINGGHVLVILVAFFGVIIAVNLTLAALAVRSWTGLVVENGQPTSYSSIYLWNQPEVENNHTPAWDVFDIPPSPPPT